MFVLSIFEKDLEQVQLDTRCCGIIHKFFLPQQRNEDTFLHFSTFQNLDYNIFKNIELNSCGFIFDNKKGPLNKCAKFH